MENKESRKVFLKEWNPEDEEFWNKTGRSVASRNLWISIPCLLCAFAVWLYWSIITVQMKNLSFPFETSQLFTLPAIAGLVGATLRIPNSFLISISGGRNVIFITTVLLIIPAFGVGIALQNIDTPFTVFAVLAALSGLGGGAFASSMSNISFFFPRKVQGTSLGLNAGLGNLGVSVMQGLLPLVMTFGLFGSLGGEGLPLAKDGTVVFIQNCGFVWVPVLIVLAVVSWFGMNNLVTASPHLGSTAYSLFISLVLLAIGFFSAGLGLYLLLAVGISKWIVLPMTILATVLLMKCVPGDSKKNLEQQYAIFKNKHNWIMTYLYTMTFGSFIGYSAAFPLLIRVVFGDLPDGSPNPNAPNPFMYAWLGPLVGSLIRPVGGWLSDKLGGAKVTQWNTVAMIFACLGVAYYVKLASNSSTPEEYFFPFLSLFLVLFITTGIGNGSTFRMISIIFVPKEAGPVLGWTSAVAAYGAFLIPKIFGEQVALGCPECALYGFAVYYVTCLVLNWYYYARKNPEIEC
jgi:NNP family nitrate/nitrite transporter-like MFS transporter